MDGDILHKINTIIPAERIQSDDPEKDEILYQISEMINREYYGVE